MHHPEIVTGRPLVEAGAVRLWIAGDGDGRTLEVAASHSEGLRGFEGTAASAGDSVRLSAPLSHTNAVEVRRRVPHLRPAPVGLRTSAGTGDRLGLATAGHARAFREHGAGITPVFAQQSVREMHRLGRDPRSVVDDATFGAVEAGWHLPVGADADHLRSNADVDLCIAAGFASFTLDPGDAVADGSSAALDLSLGALPWNELEDDIEGMLARYAGRTFDIDGEHLTLSATDARRAAAKYASALALTKSMQRHLLAHTDQKVEIEFAIDETADVTTPAEHLYLANELRRLEIDVVGFAPRYTGSFLKGVEYVGDRDELRASLRTHGRIARAFGPYKLSLHTGSDKFGIYPIVAEATRGLVHLKTSGTSYLAALEVIARHEPALVREIYAVSVAAYRADSASYPVRADLAVAPSPDAVKDDALVSLIHGFDTRQILHVAYGTVLRGPADGGAASDRSDGGSNDDVSELGHRLRVALTAHYGEYHDLLADHLGAHLAPFAKG